MVTRTRPPQSSDSPAGAAAFSALRKRSRRISRRRACALTVAALMWVPVAGWDEVFPHPDHWDMAVCAIMVSTLTVCLTVWAAYSSSRKERQQMADQLARAIAAHAGDAASDAVTRLCGDMFGTIADIIDGPPRQARRTLIAVRDRRG